MLIAQITDLHLGFTPGNPREMNQIRLEKTIAAIRALDVAPDLVLATGDLADRGEPEAYARLKAALAQLPCPAFTCPGNHDDRANYLAAFPLPDAPDGFVQYVIEGYPVRVIVLDTLEPGRHGGGYCEARKAWLQARLDEAPDRPTLIALHHPPIDTGIAWMGAVPGEAWAGRLAAAISGRPNVLAAVSGHRHRGISALWPDTLLVVPPPVAPDLALTLRDIDPEQPDGRAMIELVPPAFALHQWCDGRIISHFESVSDRKVLARFDDKLQPLVRHLAHEREEG